MVMTMRAGWAYRELEAGCDSIVGYRPDVVPGVLRTDAYAGRVRRGHPDVLLQRRLEVFGRQGKRLRFFLDPAALDPRLGREVVAEQYRHLCDLNAGPNIHIRVVPSGTGTGAGAARRRAFTLLEFDEPAYPAVVHVGGCAVRRGADVAAYRRIVHGLEISSMPVEEFVP